MTNDVSPQVLLAFLNDAWARAKDAANTLRDQLVQDQVAALQFVKQGSISSIGKNSSNQAYKNYGPGNLTHVQIVELLGNLLGLYDRLKLQITCEFKRSADFDYAIPAGFDFDPPIYELLNTAIATGDEAARLPDLSRLRLPAAALTNPALTTW